MKPGHLLPIYQVLLGAFMISFSGVWVVLADVAPTTSAFYRVFFGFLFLLAAQAYYGLSISRLTRLLLPTALCGFTFALDLFFWHASIRHVGPGLATIISNFQVFMMAGCSVLLFRETLRPRFLISLPLAFVGLFLLIGFSWSSLTVDYRLGILFGFLTAIAYTAYLLLVRNIQTANRDGDPFAPMMLISFFTAVFLAISMLAGGVSFTIPSVSSGCFLMVLGLCSQAIGWFLIAGSLPKIATSLAGLTLLLQPSLAFIWDVLFFSRPTDAIQWLGAIVALFAIYLGLTGAREKRDQRS